MKKNNDKVLSFKENDYITNYKIDVKAIGLVDKKGKFDYISWANCQKIAKEIYGTDFTWNLKVNNNDDIVWNNNFVLLEMTINERTEKHFYPILNNFNKPIDTPNSFDINNAQMRGFAKLFSMMTGIGLSLYTGEDLKIYDPQEAKKTVNSKITPLEKETKKLFETYKEQYTDFLKTKKYTKLSEVSKNDNIEFLKTIKENNNESS